MSAVKAIGKGQEVSNPTSLKQKQMITNLAGFLVGILCTWVKSNYPDFAIFDYQDMLTGAFVSILGLANYYFTIASSKKVGPIG